MAWKIMAIGMAKAISCVMAKSEQRRQRKHHPAYGSGIGNSAMAAARIAKTAAASASASAAHQKKSAMAMAWRNGGISSIKWRKWRHGVMAAWRRKARK
jgi:hypothetical protein